MRRKPETFTVAFRVTEDELKIIEASIRESGLTRADFLRAAAVGSRPPRRRKFKSEGLGELSRARRDLNTLGNNLNATLKSLNYLVNILRAAPDLGGPRVNATVTAFAERLAAHGPGFFAYLKAAVEDVRRAAVRVDIKEAGE